MIAISELTSLFHDLQTTINEMDYSQTLQDFMPVLAEQEAGMFAGEYDSSLTDWTPLKPSTVARKGHDRILVDTGALRESLVHVGGPGNINEVAPRGMLFGTEVEYAGFLQDGTSRMPSRPPVGISDETLDKLCERIADATVEKLGV